MTLNYYNLPIQYGGLIDNDWYDEPHYEHEDEVDFEYEVDDAKFIDVLSDIAIDDVPEEIPDERIQEYVKEHSDELFQKYEQEVLDYFKDKARMSAEKYYNEQSDWGRFDESCNNNHNSTKNSGVVYWEDIKDQYSDEDNYWDTEYSKEQIQAWRNQWKR